MNIEVQWEYTGHDEESLEFSRVLYAYLHPKSKEVLYLGKADYCTVRERLFGAHKESIFESMVKDLGMRELHAIVGTIYIPEGRRFSSELLSDIESLLIYNLQPHYNIQSCKTRTSRPGMEIKCKGDWPLNKKVFIDA